MKYTLTFIAALFITFSCLGQFLPIIGSGWTTTANPATARAALGFPQALDYLFITNAPWCTTGAVQSIISTAQFPYIAITNPPWTSTGAVVSISSDTTLGILTQSNFVRHTDTQVVNLNNAGNTFVGSTVTASTVNGGTINASSGNMGQLVVTGAVTASSINSGTLTVSNAVKIYSATNAMTTNALAVKSDGTIIGVPFAGGSGPQFFTNKFPVAIVNPAGDTGWTNISLQSQTNLDNNIPTNARAVILEAYGSHGGINTDLFLLIRENSTITNALVLLMARSSGDGDFVANNCQGVFPLDNVTGGHRSFQYRFTASSGGTTFTINAIGYYY